jgi:hypothetical protein
MASGQRSDSTARRMSVWWCSAGEVVVVDAGRLSCGTEQMAATLEIMAGQNNGNLMSSVRSVRLAACEKPNQLVNDILHDNSPLRILASSLLRFR